MLTRPVLDLGLYLVTDPVMTQLHGLLTTVSAAILTDGTTGAAMGLPAADTRVALTIEPAGGSEQPTSEPIVEVDPAQV